MFFVAPFLAKNVFHYPELTDLLRLTSLGILLVSLFNHLKAVLYSYRMFKKYVVILILVDLVKLSAALILTHRSKMSAYSAVAIFSASPLLGVILGTWVIRKDFFTPLKHTKKIILHLLPSSKWIFLSDITKQVFPSIGTFMLVKMLDSKAAGIYGLALNLTYIFPILISSFNSVLLPEISRFQKISQFETYLKKSLKILMYMAAAAIIFSFFSGKFILFFFGRRYADSIIVFDWLIFSYLVAAGNSVLLCSILYSLKKTRIVALADMTRLLAMVLGCFFLIPLLGATTPAILALILNITIGTFLLLYVFEHINRTKLSRLKLDSSSCAALPDI